MLKWDFFALMISKWDISNTDGWKNVSNHIGSLISNFFILNGEILTKMMWDFLISEKILFFWYWDFKIWDCAFFQSRSCLEHIWDITSSTDFISQEWIGQYIRPISVCPRERSLHMLAMKSWWKLMKIVWQLWAMHIGFYACSSSLPNEPFKYHYYYVNYILNCIIQLMTTPSKGGDRKHIEN